MKAFFLPGWQRSFSCRRTHRQLSTPVYKLRTAFVCLSCQAPWFLEVEGLFFLHAELGVPTAVRRFAVDLNVQGMAESCALNMVLTFYHLKCEK